MGKDTLQIKYSHFCPRIVRSLILEVAGYCSNKNKFVELCTLLVPPKISHLIVFPFLFQFFRIALDYSFGRQPELLIKFYTSHPLSLPCLDYYKLQNPPIFTNFNNPFSYVNTGCSKNLLLYLVFISVFLQSRDPLLTLWCQVFQVVQPPVRCNPGSPASCARQARYHSPAD